MELISPSATGLPPISNEISLMRFIYLGSPQYPIYKVGDPFAHDYYGRLSEFRVAQMISPLAPEAVVEVIKKAHSSGCLLRSSDLVFVLAVCVTRKNEKLSTLTYKLVPEICKNVEDLLLFVKFFADLTSTRSSAESVPVPPPNATARDAKPGGFGTGMRKAINQWYTSKEPLELAQAIGRCQRRHGWSHKDILCRSHPKVEDPVLSTILAYAVKGFKVAKPKAAAANILEHPAIMYLSDLSEFKACEDPTQAGRLLEVHHFTLDQVTGHMLKRHEIWEALIQNFTLKELLQHLQRIHNLGFLTAADEKSRNILPQVTRLLKNQSLFQAAKLHPLQAYIALKNYENGGKVCKYPKLEDIKKKIEKEKYVAPPPPNPQIVRLLNTMVESSMAMPASTGARFMITLDVRDEMFKESKCFQCGNVSAGMAAVIIALALLKREREVVIAVFTNKGVRPVSLAKDITLAAAVEKLRANSGGHVVMSRPFEWCTLKKKRIDVFINLIDGIKSIFDAPKELKNTDFLGQFVNYRRVLNLPNTKFITMTLCDHRLRYEHMDRYLGCLIISGIDDCIPKLIEAVARGNVK